MIFISIRRVIFSIMILIFSAGMVGVRNLENGFLETTGTLKAYRIVIDAGHGQPDGGAVSSSEIEEEGLNFKIAMKLKEELESNGFEIIMTREDENNIADSDKQTSLKQMKTSDLTNRTSIINDSKADFAVSIHMNKYDSNRYWGWQTFYSKNSEIGKKIAGLIQNGISKNIDRDNKRTPLSIEGIKIVDKTNIPVVIVECGFLSNQEDLALLQTEDYQNRIVKRYLRRNRGIL